MISKRITLKYENIAELLWSMHGLYSALIDESNHIIASWIKMDALEAVLKEEILKSLKESLTQQKENEHVRIGSVIEENSNIYFLGMYFENGMVLILGPAVHGFLDFEMKQKFIHRYKIKIQQLQLPNISYGTMAGLCQMVYYIIFEKILPLNQFYSGENQPNPAASANIIEYRKYKSDTSTTHLPYQFEQEFIERIQAGRFEDTPPLTSNDMFDGIGMLSANGMDKQFEYLVVTTITLATRAAINGGVPPMKAYEISDVLLQECSKTKNNQKYMTLLNEAVRTFTEMVIQYRTDRVVDVDVECCKEYVAKNIFNRIIIRDMAKDLNISYTYLSAKFKKMTGMGISQYIKVEKLKVVENYLRYSNRSIGDIAEYMAFSSPSRLTEDFKMQYSISPLQYRQINRHREFKES